MTDSVVTARGGARKKDATMSDETRGVVEVEPGPESRAAKPVEPTAAQRRSGFWLLIGFLIVVLIAVSGVIAWLTAATSDDLQTARTRDAVTVAAHRGIETLNSLDYQKVDAGLKKWVSVSTGTLADQLGGISSEDRKLLAEQKKVSTGKVLEAAVVNLDSTTATVIAAVEVTVADGTDPDAKPVVKRNRFSADMVLVKGDWKVENLQQVPVNLQ